MKSNRHVRLVAAEQRDDFALDRTDEQRQGRLAAPVRRAIMQARTWLGDRQHSAGYWVGELEGDTILESEFILLQAFLGRHDCDDVRKAARYIERKQLPDGGWAIYPGGDVDISASVKAYWAMKLAGHELASESMHKARRVILKHGGADSVNSFTRFYLALLGQISYDQCPAVPPEATLLPTWFPVNLYRISAWSRTILAPLAIMWAFQPVRTLAARHGIAELFLKRPEEWPPLQCPGKKAGGVISWDRFFRWVDSGLKFLNRRGWTPLRHRAIKHAERWMVERFAGSEGLGAIFPPMIWSIVALRCLGYEEHSQEVRYCHEHLRGLIIEDEDAIRLQPCKSPVWDTAIALRALADSGLDAQNETVEQGVEWLLSQEVRRPGDWAKTVKAEPAGWCFEHANEFYPDVDDTIMVMMALATQFEKPRADCLALPASLGLVDQFRADDKASASRRLLLLDRVAAASERAERWVLAMQNRDGGWGAFDRDNDREFLCHVPFADHNAMIDPSTPDLTGRVLEALGMRAHCIGLPHVDRAVAYMRSTQEADGSWFGRWGVNYVYGTWQAVVGLRKVGLAKDDPMIVAAVNWLLAHQQPQGAWGESPDSYAQPRLRGQGPATASQTAWALLGLIAAGEQQNPAVLRGVRYLLDTQNEHGVWDETEFTGTGFPQVFYLRYHLYPAYFPLMALSQWAVATGQSAAGQSAAGQSEAAQLEAAQPAGGDSFETRLASVVANGAMSSQL